MQKAVRDYMTAHLAKWNGIAANVTAHTLLKTKLTAIDAMVTEQERVRTGITVAKNALRVSLEQAILLVANPTAVFAEISGDAVLLSETDLTPTDLDKESDQTLDDVAARVKNAAESVIASLADYGVLAADITALEDAIEAFEGAKTGPDVARAERKALTEQLEPLVDSAGDVLTRQLDKLMARYQLTDAVFHSGYKAARVIIDLRGPGEDEGDVDPDPIP